jgi:hypothetical protein
MHAAVEECAARTAGQMHVVLMGSISAICPPRQGKVMVIVSIFLLGDAGVAVRATIGWLLVHAPNSRRFEPLFTVQALAIMPECILATHALLFFSIIPKVLKRETTSS